MAQSVQIDVRVGDDQLTQRLKEQIRLAEQLQRTLNAPRPAGAQMAGAPVGIQQDARGYYRDARGRYASPQMLAPYGLQQPNQADKEEQERRAQNKRRMAAAQSFMSQTTAGGMLQSVGGAVANIPFVGPIAGAYLGLKGQSLQMREQMAGQAAGLEQLEARMTGVIDTADAQAAGEALTKELQPLGFAPQEARALGLQTAAAFGRRLSSEQLQAQALELGAAERAGIPAAMLAQLAGALTEAGGGDFSATMELTKEVRNLAEQGLDLRGSGVQAFLSGVSSLATSLSGQGLAVNVRQLSDTMRGISQITGRKGQRPLQITQALSGAAGGARAAFQGQFSGLITSAIQAEAFSQADSPLEAMRIMEDIQRDPAQVQEIARRTFGTEGAALGLASIGGIGTREAEKLAAAPTLRATGAETARLTAEQLSKGLTVSAAQARQQQQLIDPLRTKEGAQQLTDLIETSTQLKTNMLQLTENAQALQALTKGLATALDYASRWVP